MEIAGQGKKLFPVGSLMLLTGHCRNLNSVLTSPVF